VLFPKIPQNPTPDQATTFEKTKQVSTFFGGTPLTGAREQPANAITVPKPTMPTAPATGAAAGGAPVKKKKEGC
jgi:hypothetical protein